MRMLTSNKTECSKKNQADSKGEIPRRIKEIKTREVELQPQNRKKEENS